MIRLMGQRRRVAGYKTPTLVGTPTTGTTTSVAITGEDVGHFILINAQRSSASLPGIGAGWTDIAALGIAQSDVSQRVGWMIADTNAEVSDTWASARRMIALILSDVHPSTPIVDAQPAQGSGTTINFPALTLGGLPVRLIRCVNLRGDAAQTITMPAGLGTEYTVASGGNGRSTLAMSPSLVTSVGAATGAQSAAGNWVSWSIGILGAPL